MNMAEHIVTVFGGTGFLGRRVVRSLRDRGIAVRVASRHPERTGELFGSGDPSIHPMAADVSDEASIARAIAGAWGVVNAVSLYVEHGGATFQSVHVEAARLVAREARKAGAERLIHISGIGADALSSSPYIRSRGLGEQAVREVFPAATLIRPAVMFGSGDAFLTVIIKLLRRLPAYPMFGQGHTRLQPAYVEDVGDSVATALRDGNTRGMIFECAGPRVYSYKELLRTVAAAAGTRPILFPLPFAIWHGLAALCELLPNPPVTRNQIELMEIDTVAATDVPGFARLGISPRSLDAILPTMVSAAHD